MQVGLEVLVQQQVGHCPEQYGISSQESVQRLGQAAAGIAANEIAPGRAAVPGRGECCSHFPEIVALEMPEGVLGMQDLAPGGEVREQLLERLFGIPLERRESVLATPDSTESPEEKQRLGGARSPPRFQTLSLRAPPGGVGESSIVCAHFVDGLSPSSCGHVVLPDERRRPGRGPRDPGHPHLRHASEAEPTDLKAPESGSAVRVGSSRGAAAANQARDQQRWWRRRRRAGGCCIIFPERTPNRRAGGQRNRAMKTPVYMDYAATTPTDPAVVAVMTRYLGPDGVFGNPASRLHSFGRDAEEAVEQARLHVADLINADPREIVWTSGATESDNLAIKGAVAARGERGGHVVTSSIEHKAVLDCCLHLERDGYEVTRIEPKADGLITPELVESALRDDTILVSLMHVNNEIGTITDIETVGRLARDRGVPFHVDAAQSAARVRLDMQRQYADFVSLSAHKMYGPKGVGALYVRRRPRARLEPQIHGGGHERGLRSGTLATHQIAGMGEAARLVAKRWNQDAARARELEARFLEQLRSVEHVSINGDRRHCVSGIVNLGFPCVESESLIVALPDIGFSTGFSLHVGTGGAVPRAESAGSGRRFGPQFGAAQLRPVHDRAGDRPRRGAHPGRCRRTPVAVVGMARPLHLRRRGDQPGRRRSHRMTVSSDVPARLEAVRGTIHAEFTRRHKIPWIVAYSGGKDSTLLLQLVWEVAAVTTGVPRRPIYIVANDTLVESPLVIRHLRQSLTTIRKAIERAGLPISVKVTEPCIDQTFWVNVIGRGYIPPTRNFRWCTDRMKIAPTNDLIEKLVLAHRRAILLVGTRKSESQSRGRAMTDRGVTATTMNPHSTIPNCRMFAPLADLGDDDVWKILMQRRPPWGGTHRELITLYRNAGGGECPLVLSKEDAPSCGTTSPRFGCWTCTVVTKDRSMRGLIDSGHEDAELLEKLFDFRAWLIELRENNANRQRVRRDGNAKTRPDGSRVLGPFTIEVRRHILDQLRRLETETGWKFLRQSEWEVIEDIWRRDRILQTCRTALDEGAEPEEVSA